jgi:hypothetical protein
VGEEQGVQYPLWKMKMNLYSGIMVARNKDLLYIKELQASNTGRVKDLCFPDTKLFFFTE